MGIAVPFTSTVADGWLPRKEVVLLSTHVWQPQALPMEPSLSAQDRPHLQYTKLSQKVWGSASGAVAGSWYESSAAARVSTAEMSTVRSGMAMAKLRGLEQRKEQQGVCGATLPRGRPVSSCRMDEPAIKLALQVLLSFGDFCRSVLCCISFWTVLSGSVRIYCAQDFVFASAANPSMRGWDNGLGSLRIHTYCCCLACC